MDLKSILPNKKDEEELFWSLIIEPEWVSAGVWKIRDNRVQVMSVSPPSPWSLDEELVSACDTSCSYIIQNFPDDVDPPKKTVFGVVSSWVDGGEIKNDFLEKIKKVCSKLFLTPVGFVVLSEALSNYFKSEEGGNVNAIFLGISGGSLELSIFRLGKLVGTSQIARSVSVVEDVTEGLSRFYSGEAYPSRIILYNTKEEELDEIRQELIKADWENYKEIKFLHTPKIEIVTSDVKLYAVCLAGGAEMGSVEKVIPVAASSALGEEDKKEVGELNDELQNSLDKESNLVEPAEDISPEDFGFTVEKENETKNNTYENTKFGSDSETDLKKNEADFNPYETPNGEKQKRVWRLNPLLFLKRFLSPKIKPPTLPVKMKFSGLKLIVFGIIFLILLCIILFAFWWYFPKADVTIYVSPRKIEDDIEITVDTSVSTSDFDNKKLSGQIVNNSTEGEKTDQTTGIKIVGEKATGEITIYRAGSIINLAKDTLVKGPQGLTFSLDNDVVVASGSVLTRGITKATVSAKEIGAQYNLASGATFTLSNYSSADMEATNESAFSGGTSREVSAVSESDQDKLLAELQGELENDLKGLIAQELESDMQLIDDSLDFSVVSSDFDKKVGDESTSLKLILKLSAEGVTVRKNDVEEMGYKYLGQKVPSGYVLKNEQVVGSFSYMGKKDGLYEMQLIAGADLLPQFNIDDIKKNITGKFPDVAEEYLNKNVPGFERAVISFKNIKLPGRLGSLPRVSNNIEITISAEE